MKRNVAKIIEGDPIHLPIQFPLIMIYVRKLRKQYLNHKSCF